MKILVIGKEGRLARMSESSSIDKHELTYIPMDADEDDIASACPHARAILVDAMGSVTRKVIESHKELEMIHSEGVGYQWVDIDAAADNQVYVCNCKGANAVTVAEHTIMLILDTLRDQVNNHMAVLEGRQIETKEGYMVSGGIREMADCTIGLVGFGDIGRQTARLAGAFGARCIYYNRSAAPAGMDFGAERKSLDQVLAESDIISMHLPVTEETKYMADDSFFSRVKDGAILINTSRGELVDSCALIRAISSGKISAAGLDCIAAEPVRKDNPLLTAPEEIKNRIIFSPHIAGITASAFKRCYAMFWENVGRIEAGMTPIRIVGGRKAGV